MFGEEKMKDKKDTPWYKWKFTFAGILLSSIMLWLTYSIIFNMKHSDSIRFIFLIPILGCVCYIAYNEWKFRKPRKFKIKNNENNIASGDSEQRCDYSKD